MHDISSSSNDNIKLVKALHKKNQREEKQLFFVEGLRIAEEALTGEYPIESVYFSESLLEQGEGGNLMNLCAQKAALPSNKVFRLPDRLFKEICDTDSPQGVLVVLKMVSFSLDEILSKVNPFIIILDSIQDPGNMGTIIRTADACGADGVILSKGCVDAYNPKTLRSTMGSVFHIPLIKTDDISNLLISMKQKGIISYGGHLSGDRSLFEADFLKPAALVIGNEANGISDDAAGCISTLVRIPMPGKAESLNASVAAGVMMYEVVRQRLNIRG